jgi:hypothetical protein
VVVADTAVVEAVEVMGVAADAEIAATEGEIADHVVTVTEK